MVNAGGDADTNATVACSLLGAKYGYSSIPKRYIDSLFRRELFDKFVDSIVDVVVG